LGTAGALVHHHFCSRHLNELTAKQQPSALNRKRGNTSYHHVVIVVQHHHPWSKMTSTMVAAFGHHTNDGCCCCYTTVSVITLVVVLDAVCTVSTVSMSMVKRLQAAKQKRVAAAATRSPTTPGLTLQLLASHLEINK